MNKRFKELNEKKFQSVNLAGINIHEMHLQIGILKSENITLLTEHNGAKRLIIIKKG